MQVQTYYLTLRSPTGETKDAWVHSVNGQDPIPWAESNYAPWFVVDAALVEWHATA